MDQLKFIFALLLLVGATRINGDRPSILPQIYGELKPINPPDVLIEPIFAEHTIPPINQINGRLLTPAEGCGYSIMGVPRVVGGGPARNGAFPWMTLLGYKAQLNGYLAIGFKCGGSMITSNAILTAAHCISPDLWFARLGEHDFRTLDDGAHEDHEIAEAIRHPEYKKGSNDIGVLRLGDHVGFTPRIRPICLPIDQKMREHSWKQSHPFAAGWGQLGAKSGSPPYLKQVQVPHIDTKTCNETFAKFGYNEIEINEMTVCAGGVEGQSICMGDSGGPLMMPIHNGNGNFSFYQMGISSWSIPCALRDIPAAFMSVQYFADFIHEKIEEFQQIPEVVPE